VQSTPAHLGEEGAGQEAPVLEADLENLVVIDLGHQQQVVQRLAQRGLHGGRLDEVAVLAQEGGQEEREVLHKLLLRVRALVVCRPHVRAWRQHLHQHRHCLAEQLRQRALHLGLLQARNLRQALQRHVVEGRHVQKLRGGRRVSRWRSPQAPAPTLRTSSGTMLYSRM
jgi:hypothetical protein